jgi:broad specificity phosphatase PhoE
VLFLPVEPREQYLPGPGAFVGYNAIEPANAQEYVHMRLLLARHGQSPGNLQGRFMGQADPPLAPEGERQALALAARLREERLDAVYTSDLRRAAATAEIVAEAGGAVVMTDPAWRETSFGAWTGLTREEVAARDPELWRRWRTEGHLAPPGGETPEDVQQRVVPAARRLYEQHPNGTVLVVTHIGPLHVLYCWILGLPVRTTDVPHHHGALSSVRWDSGGPVIEFWNDSSHAPA